MTENSAAIEVVAKHIREISELHAKYKDANLKYMEMLKVFPDLKVLCSNLKKENKQLRELLQQTNNDCKVAQESLDGAQREIEVLNEKIESLYDCGDDLRNFNKMKEDI